MKQGSVSSWHELPKFYQNVKHPWVKVLISVDFQVSKGWWLLEVSNDYWLPWKGKEKMKFSYCCGFSTNGGEAASPASISSWKWRKIANAFITPIDTQGHDSLLVKLVIIGIDRLSLRNDDHPVIRKLSLNAFPNINRCCHAPHSSSSWMTSPFHHSEEHSIKRFLKQDFSSRLEKFPLCSAWY